ncbi:MAG: hypothetical protein RL754_1255 [Bacteroidota bacterium]|jgi:cell division protein FtsL
MSKASRSLKNALGALKVTDEAVLKLLPFAAWACLLGLISISISHRADTKVHRIDELGKKRQTLEAEFTETKERLTKLSLESTLVDRAKKIGLETPENRPKKVVVKDE